MTRSITSSTVSSVSAISAAPRMSANRSRSPSSARRSWAAATSTPAITASATVRRRRRGGCRRGSARATSATPTRRDHRGVAHHSPGGASSIRTRPSSPTRSKTRATSPCPADDAERRAEVAGELDDEPDARRVQERRRAQVEHDLGVRLSRGRGDLGLQRVHRGEVDLPRGYDDDRVARAPTRHREVRTALHSPRSSQGARRTTSPDVCLTVTGRVSGPLST